MIERRYIELKEGRLQEILQHGWSLRGLIQREKNSWGAMFNTSGHKKRLARLEHLSDVTFDHAHWYMRNKLDWTNFSEFNSWRFSREGSSRLVCRNRR